ncbi:deleted in malignant brain tumors 1 protein-like isoform X2 [Lytechinus pictus]|uniref:deleted in malignant brain tumors 1 protein-like isoform X2 n=1 Tax=Lytechinus pictus TaxID=7653 RepID=UPI0030BA239F
MMAGAKGVFFLFLLHFLSLCVPSLQYCNRPDPGPNVIMSPYLDSYTTYLSVTFSCASGYSASSGYTNSFCGPGHPGSWSPSMSDILSCTIDTTSDPWSTNRTTPTGWWQNTDEPTADPWTDRPTPTRWRWNTDEPTTAEPAETTHGLWNHTTSNHSNYLPVDVNVTLSIDDTRIISSPNYPSSYHNNARYTWYIRARPRGYDVAIQFLDFETEMYYDYLTIGTGDSPNNSSQIERLSGYTYPSYVRLDEPTGWIQFTSDYSIVARGFQLEISLINSSIPFEQPTSDPWTDRPTPTRWWWRTEGPRTEEPVTNPGWWTPTNYPPVEEYVYLVAGHPWNITSPNYPSNYHNSARYTWYIVAPEGYEVVINVLDFRTEQCCDFLKIGTGYSSSDGQIQYQISGYNLPSDLRLNGTRGWIEFYSDGSVTDRGFFIEIDLEHTGGETRTEEPVTNPGWWTPTNDPPVEEYVYLVAGHPWNITSPNYPSNYHNSARYTWYIVAPEGYEVVINVLDFRTEQCCDFLKIGTGYSSSDGQKQYQISGYNSPSDLRLNGTRGWIEFYSDGSVTDRGFFLQINLEHTGGGPFCHGCCDCGYVGGCYCDSFCQGNGDCCHDYALMCTNETRTEEPVTNPGWWTPTNYPPVGEYVYPVAGHPLNITSPNYPSNYHNSARYTWYIVAPEGYEVVINVLDFRTEQCCDFLNIGTGYSPSDGQIQYQISGYNLPSDLRLNGTRGWIEFYSDGSVTDRGFFIEIDLEHTGGETRTEEPVTNPGWWTPTNYPPVEEYVYLVAGHPWNITSPNYPSNYHNSARYTWYIEAPEGYEVVINVLDFRTEQCCDFLKIGTGYSSSDGQKQYQISGSNSPSDLRLNGTRGWIEFYSDGSVTDRGFFLQINLEHTGGGPFCHGCCDCGYVGGCYCDSFCQGNGDCCHDYAQMCTNETITNLHCDSTSMTLIMDKDLLEIGDHASDVHFDDESCVGYYHDMSHVAITTPYDGCGTKQEVTEDSVIYTNMVTFYKPRPQIGSDGVITREHYLQTIVRCSLEREQVLGVFYEPKTGIVLIEEEGYGEFSLSLERYTGPGFNQLTNDTGKVILGTPLYYGIQLASVANLTLLADSCWATNSPNPLSYARYDIIDGGCGVDSTVYIPGWFSQSFTGFKVDAFAFIRDYEEVFIHCSILICDNEDPDNRCSQGCVSRYRRSPQLTGSRSKPHTITSGPISDASRFEQAMMIDSDGDGAENFGPPMITVMCAFSVFVALTVILSLMIMRMRRNRPEQIGYQPVDVALEDF